MSEKDGVCAFVPAGHQGDGPSLVFGMGILVGNREVLTCAHVIDTVLGSRWDRSNRQVVHVYFPFSTTKTPVAGHVDTARWYPVNGPGSGPTDAAVVVLDEHPPSDVEPASLMSHQLEHQIRAFGFRTIEVAGKRHTSPHGDWAAGFVAGALTGGRVQGDRLSLTGVGVEPGFSGAGVYDKKEAAVVGMMAAVDSNPERNYFQFIDVEMLRAALGSTKSASPATPRTVRGDKLQRTKAKMAAIEGYLQEIVTLIPQPRGDQASLDYLKILLKDGTDSLARVRVAFGLPQLRQRSRALYAVVASTDASAQPFVNVLAQRLYHLLWRLEESLKFVTAPWSATAQATVRALQTTFEPDVLARSPTLAQLSPALEYDTDMTAFTEPGPDPELYAVLRALGHASGNLSTLTPDRLAASRTLALNYLLRTLENFLDDEQQADDTSNIWWAVRTGMCERDGRFRPLLRRVAESFADVRPIRHGALRGNAVREIYTEKRTVAYTLSNIQAIFEVAPDLDQPLKMHLHAVVEVMCQRLLDMPLSDHLYLAAVHYEGLRNYLDYVEQQTLPVT